MKKIKILLAILLLCTACSNNSQKDTEKEIISINEETNTLWNEDTIDNTLVSSNPALKKDKFSIEFWVKPSSNKTSTVLFSFGDNEHFVQCTTLGSNFELDTIQYSGITLLDKNGENETWLVADGINTIQTGKYNQVVINFDSGKATIYLNGEKIAHGDFPLGSIENYFQFGRSFNDNPHLEGVVADLTISSVLKTAEEIKNEYTRNKGRIVLDSISFYGMNDLTEGLYLVDYKIDDIPIMWKSSNPEVLDTNKKYQPQDQDTLVTMTAYVEIEGIEKVSKDFQFMVKHVTDEVILDRDSKDCNSWINKVIHSGSELPSSLTNGSSVVWEVMSGEAIIKNNQIIKTGDEEHAKIHLKAILSKGESVRELEYDFTLLDEVGGYLLSYFDGELGEETGRLAYSLDGLHWEELNDGKSIITSTLGTKRIRDPFITRDIDGNFVVLATEGFDNPSIYIIRSNDLIDLSNQRLIQVSYYDEGLQMDGTRAWAPEMLYDMQTNQYIVYFSNPSDKFVGQIYAVNTVDLENVSYPYSLFSPGYTVIDATIHSMNGKYWLFYKDEREGAKTIFYATSPSISSGFRSIYDYDFIFDKKYIEAPFIVKSKEYNYLYVDNYPTAKFYVARFHEKNGVLNFEWLNQDEYNMPNHSERHGSVLEMTTGELNKLIEYYNQ